jgi:putative ATPase
VRRALTLLEIAAELAADEGGAITAADAAAGAGRPHAPLRQGRRAVLRPDLGAAQIGAQLQPGCALYWLARMLDGGCDPIYLARA